MTYEDFLGRFDKAQKTSRGVLVRCPAHEDRSASLSVGRADDGGVLLKCFAGCTTDAVMASLGLAVKDLFAKQGFTSPSPRRPSAAPKSSTPAPVEQKYDEELPKPVVEKIYSYTDAIGREIYQAIRLKPKSFRQRSLRDGKWSWSMDGVERVLYRLPEVLKAEKVWIVEGEKDADNLAALGFCSTCNVGGAGKWLDGYSASLEGKQIVICGDNDAPGQKHVELVFESMAGRAKSVKLLKLPSGVKDASDYIATFGEAADAKKSLEDLEQMAVPHMGGISMPVYSMADIEPMYKAQVDESATTRLDLGAWLPSFRSRLRPLVPGELCLIVADTGAGKTAILQNIAITSSLTTLMFEMELPPELLFERFFALRSKLSCRDVEAEYRNNGSFGSASVLNQFPRLFICPESKMTLEKLESIIIKSDLKTGTKPNLVLIDYVQLIQGPGSRYEKTSNIAEGLKIIAKTTRTIVVVTSQISRPEAGEEISLHSGKDSGSLENSAGLVLGAWRDQNDPALMLIKILKSTKGGAGFCASCNFNGATMAITERSKISDADVPPRLPASD